MSEKPKHPTLHKKYEILKSLEKGDRLSHLSREYNIGRATIHDIEQKKNQIELFFKSTESCTSVRKTLKSGFH